MTNMTNSKRWDDGPISIKQLEESLVARWGKELSRPHESSKTCQELKQEEEIVWVFGFDPEKQRYVRETVERFCHRRRGALRYCDFRVVGWSNLYRDADNNGMRGIFTRRIFWLKPYDWPAKGPYEKCFTPVEAVDPLTVHPTTPGALTDRAVGDHPLEGVPYNG